MPVSALSYGYDGVLTLSNAGSVVARINLLAGAYPVGSWQVVKGAAGGFLLSVGADGHTRLTVSTPAPVTASGHSAAYTAAAAWAGGAAPGSSSAVTLGPAASPYVVTTGTANAAASALLIDGAQATLEVDRYMLAAWQPAVVAAGTLAIAAGASLQSSGLVQLGPTAVTRIDRGGQLVLGGRASGPAVAIEGTLLDNGGKIAAGPKQASANATGGAIAIGLGNAGQPAVVTVQAGGQVSDTGTMLGAGPASSGTLALTGAGTSWTDLADPTQTQNTTGTMLVGVPAPGAGAGPAASPATLLVAQGAVLTEAGYAEIGVAPGSSGAATVSAGARWQVGAGALTIGAGGAGTLSILNGGTVTAGTGRTFLAGGTALAMPFGVEAGQSGTGAITVSGTGSVLLTPGSIVLGGGGQGTLTVSGGGLAEAGGLQVRQGSVASVDPAGAIDVGNSGQAIAGAVLIESGRTLLGNGLIAANVVNNGTVLAVPAAAGPQTATLEIAGALSGTGTLALAGGAAAQIDGAVGAGQTIMFAPGGGLLELLARSSTFLSPLVGLNTGDRISSPQWTQILSAQAVGHSVVVQTRTGTTVLSNVSFASGASGAFVWYKDPASGNWTIEVTPPVVDWSGGPRGGDLGTAGNWRSEQTGLPAAVPPSPSNSVVFATGGTLTGTLAALDASFGGLFPWTLAGASLTLAGRSSTPNPPPALTIGASLTMSGATITAAGSTVIGAYGGVCVSVLSNSTLSTAGAAIGASASQAGTLAVNAGGTVLLAGPADLGRDAGSTGSLSIAAGGRVRLTASQTSPALIVGDAGKGLASITGTGALLDLTGSPIAIGAHGGAGTLSVTNGGTVLAGTSNAGTAPAVAVGVLGPGTLVVSGAGSRLSATGGISVGLAGSGTLSVAAGAVASIAGDGSGQGGLAIGVGAAASAQTGGSGAASVATGGVLRSATWIDVGGGGDNGALSVNGGSIEAGVSLIAGTGGGGSGSITIGAGGVLTVGTQPGNPALVLGLAGSSGTIAIGAGGSLDAGRAALSVGAGGQGVLAVGAGTASAGTLTVGAAGTIAVGAGGKLAVAQSISIAAGGTLGLQSGNITAAQITNGGRITGAGTIVQATIVNTGTIGAGSGTLIVEGSIGGAGLLAVGPQATLQLNAGIAAGQTVAFQGTGTLAIEAPTAFSGTITGFGAGDRIAVEAMAPLSQSWNAASGTLLLSGSGQSMSLHIAGTHTAADFASAIIPIGLPSSAAVPATGVISVAASNALVQPGTGTHTLYLSGAGDTITVPAAGQGFLDIFGPALTNGNQLDFRQALSAAGWPGSTATLSQFMQVGTTSGAALVSITPKGAAAPTAVVRLEGQSGLTLSGLVAHALI